MPSSSSSPSPLPSSSSSPSPLPSSSSSQSPLPYSSSPSLLPGSSSNPSPLTSIANPLPLPSCSSSLTHDHNYFQFPSLPSPSSPTSSSTVAPHASKTITPPSDADKIQLLASLAKCKSKPAILALSKDHSSSYIPLSLNPDLPPPFSKFYDDKYFTFNYAELLCNAEDLSLSITPNQCDAVEVSTKSQSKSRLWFNMRTGRVTASKLRAVCVSDESTPPQSLIMSCCYPEMVRFKTSATSWGCKHENEARQKYALMSSSSHDHLSVHECGFFIHPDYPFVGASPDGLISCSCCGEGVCEIKVCFIFSILYCA